MLQRLADRISHILVSSGAASEGDREIMAFGWYRILSNILQYGILLASSLMLGIASEIMAYTCMFALLKRYAGGAHAQNPTVCLVLTSALPYISYGSCRLVPAFVSPYAAMGLSLITLGIILLRAPVAHPKNPKKPGRLKKLRKASVRIASAQSALIALCVWLLPDRAMLYVLCGAAGGLSAGVSLLLPNRVKGGEVA